MIEKSGRPAYLQIADDVRSKVRTGEFAAGKTLPSIVNLAAQYDVSASVIKAAINVLRTEGIVVGQQGKGVFVRTTASPESDHRREVDDPIGKQLTEILDALRDFSARLSRLEAEVFATRPRTPPSDS